MDYSKIFLKEAVPTSIGGQAIMEGVMMRSEEWTAIALRLPGDEIYLKREKNPPKSKLTKIPFVRGIISFFNSFIIGMKTLMDSTDVLEQFMPEEEKDSKPGFIERHLGERAAWNMAMTFSVIFALVVSVAVFVILPTWSGDFLAKYIGNSFALNLIEGLIRIVLFVLYILAISGMEDIKRLFQYHGAEHKSIHTFENGLELIPENAHQFETLHPRCGTSFIMFVFIISLLLFSFLGWPNLAWRIFSRLALLPVIAGISYELLKWAGRSDNIIVKVLSTPGLLLQKLTTKEPDDKQLEIAIVSLKAVLAAGSEPEMEAIVDKDMNIIRKLSLMLKKDNKKASKEKETLTGGAMAPAASKEEESDKLEFELYIDPRSVAGVIAHGTDVLAAARKPNAKHDATEIFCYAMGYSHADIITRSTEVIFADDIKEYDRLIELRASGVPLQYIIKVQGFMGLLIRVNSDVLIPRLDTEILVEQTIGLIKGKNLEAPIIADVCTGSGAIGIALAHEFPKSEITMTDISDKAISTAISNAQINGVYERCMFLTGDMFDALYEGKLYDIITCNPPYIRTDVIEELDEEVKDHEPLLALNGGEDGLTFYRIIAAKAAKHLKNGGYLILEIGADQAEEVSRLLAFSGEYERLSTVKDLAGLDRVIVAEKK